MNEIFLIKYIFYTFNNIYLNAKTEFLTNNKESANKMKTKWQLNKKIYEPYIFYALISCHLKYNI